MKRIARQFRVIRLSEKSTNRLEVILASSLFVTGVPGGGIDRIYPRNRAVMERIPNRSWRVAMQRRFCVRPFDRADMVFAGSWMRG